MAPFWITTPRRTFLVGLGLGLMVGAGLLVGSALTASLHPLADLERQLLASTTHGGDSMAMATGLIDEGTEGVFLLDFVTGELTCQVLNPRFGTLAGLYKRTVSQDLGVEPGKPPKYLMVTGSYRAQQNVSNVRPAESLIYVADANTGRYAAYLLPWNRAALAGNVPQASPMILIGSGTIRTIAIEK